MARRHTTKQTKAVPRKRQRKPPAKPRKTLVVRVKAKHKAGVGRKKGTKNKVPTHVKHTIKAIMDEVVQENCKDIKQAMIDGINSGPLYASKYIELARDSTDGKPISGVDLKASFKEDELLSASRDLERKMNALFKHVNVDPATADPSVSETSST